MQEEVAEALQQVSPARKRGAGKGEPQKGERTEGHLEQF